MFAHSDLGNWPNDSVFVNQPESILFGGPFVNAGTDQVINLPENQVTLTGSATDDGTISTYSWTQQSGPNTAVLSGASSAVLSGAGLVQGSYVFRLTVMDDENNTAYDEVTVEVVHISIIGFEADGGFANGELDGQVGWNAEDGWIVNTNDGGSAVTTANNSLAVLNLPIRLAPGETFAYSMDFEFSGTYAVPTGFVYTVLSGLKADASSGSVSTGGHEPDVNVQLQTDGKYRLLNNYAIPSGAGSVSSGDPDGGDRMQLDYELTMGSTAADTFYTVRLQNLTDGTDTGTGTVSGYRVSGVDYAGIGTDVYNALAGSGAYLFFQRINPAANNSGLNAFQVNSVTVNLPVADAFSNFEAQYGLTGGMEGDDDGDGQENFLEFALGSNPTNPADTGLFYLDFTADGNGHLFVPQLKGSERFGMQYMVEVCTDITEDVWVPLLADGMFTNDLPEKPEHDLIQYRFRAGSDSPEQRYLRIVVEQL
ncbi:hypothetical protein EGM51_05505 [Verrucomicrobia bacterium S94]|nr:hypothetical protein EGM51_05505 [Verrucomicrobia bacterium S94]